MPKGGSWRGKTRNFENRQNRNKVECGGDVKNQRIGKNQEDSCKRELTDP